MPVDNVSCRFVLPYIVQPEGVFDFNYDDEAFHIKIKHHIIPPLLEVITGIKYDPKNPVSISGASEIFKGVSEVEISLPTNFSDFSKVDDTALRNHITDLLNEFQYCYLHCSGKSWGNAISADHFVNMQFTTSKVRGSSSSWGGSHRRIPSFLRDEETLPEFKKFIEKEASLPAQYEFLVDARKHYMSGEYHLMYVEIAVAFENLVSRAFKKIFNVYEKQMFKEGKLQGQIAYLLNQYFKWDDKQIEAIITMCQRRNEVVHNNRRKFPHEEAYEHLVIGEVAIRAITGWISPHLASD